VRGDQRCLLGALRFVRDQFNRDADNATYHLALGGALWEYLRGAYRDPYAARAQLSEMVKQQGWTSTAARIAKDPTQLGDLRGKVGLFAGAKARAERSTARSVAEAIAPSLDRIAAAEAGVAQSYRDSVQAQRTADATPIPKLTAPAEAAVAALAAAQDDKVRAEVWRSITANNLIAIELQLFSAAVQQRFGEDAVRAMLRSEGGLIDAVSVPRQHRTALATVSRAIYLIKDGERAHDRQAQAKRHAQRQTFGYRRWLKP
jgi:hypothetical protein